MRMLETFPRRSWANLVASASMFALVLTVYIRNQNDQNERAIVRHVDDKPSTSSGLTGDKSSPGANLPHDVAASAVLHPQCYRKNPTDHANRPILIFKYRQVLMQHTFTCLEGISVLRSRSICRRSTSLFWPQNRLNIIFFWSDPVLDSK